MIVYLIQNNSNGRWYIGKGISTISRRWKEHLREAKGGRGYTLHAAIRKYGSSSFSISVLAEVDTHELAYALESFCIALLRKIDPKGTYNENEGGSGSSGRVVSAETRKKLSEARLGIKFSKEHLKNLSDAHKGKSNGPWTQDRRTKFRTSIAAPSKFSDRLKASIRSKGSDGKFQKVLS